MSDPVKIETLDQLVAAVADKRAIVVPGSGGWEQPRPAAVVINHTGAILHRLFTKGMFIYEAPTRRSAFGPSGFSKEVAP